MGVALLTSICMKVKNGEPLSDADVRYVRQLSERARLSLLLPVLLAVVTWGIVILGVLAVKAEVTASKTTNHQVNQ